MFHYVDFTKVLALTWCIMIASSSNNRMSSGLIIKIISTVVSWKPDTLEFTPTVWPFPGSDWVLEQGGDGKQGSGDRGSVKKTVSFTACLTADPQHIELVWSAICILVSFVILGASGCFGCAPKIPLCWINNGEQGKLLLAYMPIEPALCISVWARTVKEKVNISIKQQ